MAHWQRNFRAVWPSLFVVSAGMMAFVPMLPLYVRDRFGLEGDALQLWTGLIYGGAPLAAALIGPAWGVLGDRRGRKPMALRALYGIAAVVALMPLAETPLQLLALRLVQGVLSGYVAPAMALVSADLPPERQGRTISDLQVAIALGILCGPVIGAELAARAGMHAVFYVTAGLAFLSSLPVLLFARESALAPRRRGPPVGFRSALLRFLSVPRVLGLLGVVFLVRFGQMMCEAFLALRVDELGPLPWLMAGDRAAAVARTTSWMFVVLALGQILFTARWGRLGDRVGPMRALAALSVALGVLLIPSGLTGDITTFFVLRCLIATVLAGGMALSYAAVAKRIEPESRGLAFACVQSFMQFGMFSGPLCGGLIAGFVGLGGVFVAAGVASFVAAAVILRLRSSEQRSLAARNPVPALRSDDQAGT